MFCIDIDISGRKAAEDEARYLAFYDALTATAQPPPAGGPPAASAGQLQQPHQT
jgi:hypothetical protein